MDETLPHKNEWSPSELLAKASGGLALKGILVSKNLTDLLQERSTLLEVPEKCSLLGPSMIAVEQTASYESDTHAANFKKSLEKLGEGFSSQLETGFWGIKIDIKGDYKSSSTTSASSSTVTKSTYTSWCKKVILPTTSIQLKPTDLRLSEMALNSLREVEDNLLYRTTDTKDTVCDKFLEQFGSHVNSNNIHLGAIYLRQAKSSVLKHEEKQLSEEVMTQLINMDLVTDIFGQVSASVSATASQFQSILDKKYKRTLLDKIQVSIHKIGGPIDAPSLAVWTERTCLNSSTWRVIDRGCPNDLVPVWRIILEKHRKDFKNVQVLTEALQGCWEAKTGLKDNSAGIVEMINIRTSIQDLAQEVEKWNNISESDFDMNCTNYVSQCANIKSSLGKHLTISTDTLWYNEFICNSSVQKFLSKVLRCMSSENEAYLKVRVDDLLKPQEMISVKDFPNISEIIQGLDVRPYTERELSFSSVKEAKQHILKLEIKFRVVDTGSEFEASARDELGKALFELQLFYKQNTSLCASLLLPAMLHPISYKPDGTMNQCLEDSDWIYLISQLDRIESFREELQNKGIEEQQAYLLYIALSAWENYKGLESDFANSTAVLQMLCEELNQEMLPQVRDAVMTSNGTIITDVKLMKEILEGLSCKGIPGSQLSDSLSAFGNGSPCQNTESPNDPTNNQTVSINSSKTALPPNILTVLGLHDYYPKKLSLRQMREISADKLKDIKPTGPEGIPWHFLQRVLMVNSTARNPDWPLIQQLENHIDVDEDFADFFEEKEGQVTGIHPLDVAVATFLCADHFLRQELMLKMSLCQFALPFLLPDTGNHTVTFLLWAMRSIIKQWRPQSLVGSSGFVEENIAISALPTFSFIKLGQCSISKSKMLNLTLSRTEQQQNFFLHSQMEYCHLPREMSDGLAEICWYLPCGKVNLDILPEACAFINLRGEAKAHQQQAQFLTKVSDALFVFVDIVGEEEREYLTSLAQSPTQFFLITNSSGNEHKIRPRQMKELFKALNLQGHQLLVRKDKNDAQFVEILRSRINKLLTPRDAGQRSLEGMAEMAKESGIHVDEDEPEMKRGKQLANDILVDIDSRDIAQYKQTALPFQGKPWQDWSRAEKEKCRMKHCQNKPMELYGYELNQKQTQIRKTQRKKHVSKEMKQFIAALKTTSEAEQGFFMQWLKLGLDSKSREIISALRVQSKTLQKMSKEPSAELNVFDQKIADSSLGLEHFMRELSQIYEVCATLDKESISENTLQMLPGIAADLMLGGFPLELIDGDVSNIPVQWVTAVLKGVNRRVGSDCRIFVLTVLGVQSTGKSTLLNTMFGLQFAVSSGRCTRGAYMQLIKLTGSLVTELGCDFIMVIDTEGLKAAELASLEDSYEHDNELATLVIGLSDVTLVNMSMENSTEMKDILQIVVHSFIRMRATGKKPICQFVHQNVAGVSAHDQTLRDRQKLLEQLDEMTESAARMEKLERVTFCDVLAYDTDRNNWYIPGLWHGVPPMAAVNTGYSEHAFELKKSLFTCFSNCNKTQMALTIPDFIKWMSGLWDQIKHENFIFSFQNSLVAEAYSHLSRNYSAWDLELRTFIHTWTIEAENTIKNTEELKDKLKSALTLEILKKMEEKKNEILNKLEKYYESRDHNVHLMESYREQFRLSIQSLCSQLQDESIQKCNEIIRIHEALDKVNKIWDEYNKQIENEVMSLLEFCKKDGKVMDEHELQDQFKRMWRKALEKLNYQPPKETNIEADIENLLRKNMPTQGKVINEALSGKPLSQLGFQMFVVEQKHIDVKSFLNRVVDWMDQKFSKPYFKRYLKQATNWSELLEKQCIEDINNIGTKDMDYDSKHCVDMFNDVDKKIEEFSHPEFKMSEIYKAEFKLHMCGYAARRFNAMHKAFINKHNPRTRMENMKTLYLELFKQIYTQQDMTQKGAELFAKHCFKPAVRDAILKSLSQTIVVDMRKNDPGGEYSFRNSFTMALLVHLNKENSFSQYLVYIHSFEKFAKNWLDDQVIDHCKMEINGVVKLIHLAKVHLKEITDEAKEVVREVNALNVSGEARSFLDLFVEKLKKKLVMPKDSLKLVIFQPESKARNFVNMVLPCIEEAEASLLEELAAWDVKAKIRELPVKPHEEILKKLICCTKKCPFCQACCESDTPANHAHFSHLHRPEGLNGFSWNNSGRLVTDICTASVASECRFQNSDTNRQWVKYKDYQTVNDYYKSWLIQNSPCSEASSYWKNVFYTFNDKFAEHHGLKRADITNDWNIPWDKVKDDLNKTFHVNLQ